MRELDFALVGAPRSGTTALVRLLDRHPSLSMCDPKEPFYYCRHMYPGLAREQGVDDRATYCRLLDRLPRDKLIGEATTLNLSCPEAIAEMLADHPRIRLIVLLRNPAEMIPSLYQQFRLQGFETRRFADAVSGRASPGEIARFPDRALADYWRIAAVGQQLAEVARQVPRARLLVLHFVPFVERLAETAQELARFLGIEPFATHSSVGGRNASRVARGPLPALLRRRPARAALRQFKSILPTTTVDHLRRVRDAVLYSASPPPAWPQWPREFVEQQATHVHSVVGPSPADCWVDADDCGR